MRSLYIAATEASAGKTTLAVGLALAFRARGIDVGYFKPVGAIGPSGSSVDEDALFVADVLGLSDDPAQLCPTLLEESGVRIVAGDQEDPGEAMAQAYAEVSGRHDLVICEGLGEVWQGRFLRVSGADVVNRLLLPTLLVARFAGTRQLDDVLYVHDVLKERMLGVVFTMVPETRMDAVEHHYMDFLGQNGVGRYGILPCVADLAAVSVSEITAGLSGTILTAVHAADRLAQTYLIGAMSPQHALGYFKRTPDKVVVVGGDRDDLIMVALKTPTVALVLTGDFKPGAEVVAAAESAGVPLISVSLDTVHAAESLRRLFGRLRVHQRAKLAAIERLIAERTDVDKLLAALK